MKNFILLVFLVTISCNKEISNQKYQNISNKIPEVEKNIYKTI